MTSFDDGLDRRLTARLDERAAPLAPVGLSEALDERVGATKQRPAWATTERWISMETRAQFGAVPRAVVVLALLALLTLATATAIAIGASIATKPAPPFGAAGNGLIAYVSGGDIWTVDPMGGDPRQLTSDPGVEDIPTWSRDGTKLAYWTATEDGSGELVVIDADGGNAVTVAETSRPYATLEWSADGTELMYDAIVPELVPDTCPDPEDDDYSCGARLFVAATDGTGSWQAGDPDLTARIAVLSPDGHTVAFGGGGVLGSEALYLMEWDGSDVRRLETGIPGGGDDLWPFSGQSWSPDGKRIATHDGNGQIWVVDIDDSGALETVERLVPGYFPTYAPAGDAIMEFDGRLNAEDKAGTAPTYTGLISFNGRWSPDATQLVKIEGEDLQIFDRETGDITVVGAVEATPGLTGPSLYDSSEPSWQRVAP
jgi:hypothetical protein